MKMSVILTFFICFLGFVHGQNRALQIPQSSLIQTSPMPGEQDEVNIVEQMIVATSMQLQTQKALKELMLNFIHQKEEFVQGNQTKAHTGYLVRTARQIHEMIQSSHLEHLFSQEYRDEIAFFSSIAGKAAIKRP